ncbi:MAG: hypothetical protein WA857_13125 [Candidatus Acidiferrum sp.]
MLKTEVLDVPKKEWEYAAKDRFLAHLKRTRGEGWKVLRENYRVNEQTGKDFDFQLGLGDRRVALEMFRLTDDGPTLAAQYTWIEIAMLIEREFEARGIVGLAMNTPPYFSVPKAHRTRFVTDVCDKLEPHVQTLEDGGEISLDGFHITKIDGLKANVSSRHYGFGVFNPVGKAYEPISRLLPEKNAQLNVIGHERAVLIVNWANIVTANDMREALQDIDLQSLLNIDCIYFEPAVDQIELVFERALDLVISEGEKSQFGEIWRT